MRIVFLQNKGKSYGGVWQVNKMVGEALIKDGYEVAVVSIRENHNDYVPEHDSRMQVLTLNKKDEWETYSWTEIIKSMSFKKLKNRLYNNKTMRSDKERLKDFLDNYKPNYIITSHYQLLDMLPKKYLNITYNEQHASFENSWNHRATRKTFIKYNNKIKFIWLCKNSMDKAIEKGLNNNTYIYNAVRFETKDIADVCKNEKLIAISRISKDKSIDKMIEVLEEVFKDSKYRNWSCELWGDGDDFKYIESIIKSKQIKLMGRTDNPKEKLLASSINLNSSRYEGFSLSILEANECGLPTVAFNFGESCDEEILDGKTGFIAKDKDDYINKLKMLMDNKKLLQEMSSNCKKYNDNFKIKIIVKEWEKLFK